MSIYFLTHAQFPLTEQEIACTREDVYYGADIRRWKEEISASLMQLVTRTMQKLSLLQGMHAQVSEKIAAAALLKQAYNATGLNPEDLDDLSM